VVRRALPAEDRPIALYGLLFTIIVLFALQGKEITGHPLTSYASPHLCCAISP